ncbi:YagK/YfjJ domain-containing protein [Thiomicrorhabdus cannonii]|uniref:YagK/YfjJ domain-containing protein n=1 Tax=Thiomicrorhabdus cannonii TaxID=2748011 RepID=UPI0015C050E8|nr:inovirus-type Gp2 protein [Thiomicrorhabdus cannonii]
MKTKAKKVTKFPKAYLEERTTHQHNKDLRIYYDSYLGSHPLQELNGPFIYKHLMQLIHLIKTKAPKSVTVRCELLFPEGWSEDRRLNRIKIVSEDGAESYIKNAYFSKDYFSRFIDSLEAKMEALRQRDRNRVTTIGNKPRVRMLDVDYARSIEFGGKGKGGGMHIHALLFFNGQRFQSIGNLKSHGENEQELRLLKDMIHEAWASALMGTKSNDIAMVASDLDVFEPQSAQMQLREFGRRYVHFSRIWSPRGMSDPVRRMAKINSIICWASYICKASTKLFNKGIHPFRASETIPVDSKPYDYDKSTFHQGNPNLKLLDGNSYANFRLPNDAGSYIESHLHRLYGFLDFPLSGRLMDLNPEFRKRIYRPAIKAGMNDMFAVRLRLNIGNEDAFLRNRKRYTYAERFFQRLNSLLFKEFHNPYEKSGLPLHWDKGLFRIHAAQARKRDELGRLFIECVIILPDLVAQRWFDSAENNGGEVEVFLHRAVADVYRWSSEHSKHMLKILSVHPLKGKNPRWEKQVEELFQNVASLALSGGSASVASTLYFYPIAKNQSQFCDCNKFR